jgi:bifunctional DNase/RNase
VASEKYLCEPHAKKFFGDFRSRESIGGGLQHVMLGAACVDLEMIAYRIGRENDPVCMYVHEVGGIRRLCILTDAWAWWALMAQIKEEAAPRPRTHAAWAATIADLGGQLQDVVLDRHEGEDWWTAKLRIVKDGRLVTLDVRASDAYILAVINRAPIFVVERALERFADRGEGVSGD